MDNISEKKAAGGEITIFLTLILLILLSFFAVAIESARWSALVSFSERNLRLAVQGVFSEYCRPLWEDYHLFMLEGDGDKEARLLSEIEKYQSEISGNLYRQENQAFAIASTTPFLEGGGKCYLDQITKYMKYHCADSYLAKEKSNTVQMEDVKAQAKEQVNELEEAEENAQIDRSLLKVIRLIEGAVISNGKVKVSNTFIKQICPGEINAYTAGVNSEVIWEALQSEYIPCDEVSASKCRRIVSLINQVLEELEQMEQKRRGAGQDDFNQMYHQVLGMKDTLISNRAVLVEYLQNKDDEDAGSTLSAYQIKPLQFDYGPLNLKETQNPVDSIKKSFHSNLLSLVVEKEESIPAIQMPTAFMVAQSTKESADSCSSTMSEMDSEDSEKVKKSFSMYAKDTAFDNAINTALEISYYREHFSNYLSDRKEPFQYEQEYIIAGGKTEKEALGTVLDQLLLERGMFNFMYLLTDKEKSEKAHITALALVGYSGMEPLVQIVKTSILLCWAVAEAVIDLAILLQGKEIPLWKTRQSFLLSYEELFSFGKPLVMKKAKQFIELSGGGVSYQDYLSQLLLVQKQGNRVNRSLTLIQKNMEITYYEDFSLQNGMIGICADATYTYHKNRILNVNVTYCY